MSTERGASTWLADELATAWPEVRRRVLAGLRSRVPPDVAEDALQEAAMRLWRAQPELESVDAVVSWTLTAARRVVIDGARRRMVTVALEDEADGGTVPSAEPAATARIEMSRVARAFQTLRATDQQALRSTLSGEVTFGDRREAVRFAVRVHRARARLIEAIERLGGIVVVTLRRLRSVFALVRDGGAVPALGVAAAVGALVASGFSQPESVRPEPSVLLPRPRILPQMDVGQPTAIAQVSLPPVLQQRPPQASQPEVASPAAPPATATGVVDEARAADASDVAVGDAPAASPMASPPAAASSPAPAPSGEPFVDPEDPAPDIAFGPPGGGSLPDDDPEPLNGDVVPGADTLSGSLPGTDIVNGDLVPAAAWRTTP